MTSNPSSRIDGTQAGWGRFAEVLTGISSRPPLPNSESKTGRLWNVALARGSLLKAVNSKEQELLAARRMSSTGSRTKGEKLIRITPRHCVVCLRDDRPGEHRKSGFKCMACIGKPTPHNVVVVHDEEHSVRKGVRDGGEVVFGSYEMVHMLGSGAFGKVMLCYHLVSGQAYAAKVIDKARLIKKTKIRFRGGSTQDSQDGSNANRSKKEEVDLAKKEVKIMSELNHPNVIKMIGSMDSEDHLFILMEYLPNGQIYKLDDDPNIAAKPIRTPLLKCYTVGIARGLKYLHGKGICHRDIKPENILLDGHNNVKLADFGVSAQTDCNSESFNVTGFAGTPAYMPPEAFEKNSNEGDASDCWSFGVTLYCMGFGKQPFVCDNLYQYSHAIRESEVTFNHEDAQFNQLLGAMMNRNPYLRISMDNLLRHPFVSNVRIVRGQPVEEIQLDLNWDEQNNCLRVENPTDSCEGNQRFMNFFRNSKNRFTITDGGKIYKMTLYDDARDPIKQKKEMEEQRAYTADGWDATIHECNNGDIPGLLDQV